jgi:hypothetical protein
MGLLVFRAILSLSGDVVAATADAHPFTVILAPRSADALRKFLLDFMSLAFSGWLLAVGGWLLAVGSWLLVVGDCLQVNNISYENQYKPNQS